MELIVIGSEISLRSVLIRCAKNYIWFGEILVSFIHLAGEVQSEMRNAWLCIAPTRSSCELKISTIYRTVAIWNDYCILYYCVECMCSCFGLLFFYLKKVSHSQRILARLTYIYGFVLARVRQDRWCFNFIFFYRPDQYVLLTWPWSYFLHFCTIFGRTINRITNVSTHTCSWNARIEYFHR